MTSVFHSAVGRSSCSLLVFVFLLPMPAYSESLVLSCTGIVNNRHLPEPFRKTQLSSTLVVMENKGVIGGEVYLLLKNTPIPFDPVFNRITEMTEGKIASRFSWMHYTGATKELHTVVNRLTGDLVITDSFAKGQSPSQIYEPTVSFVGQCKKSSPLF